MARVRSVANVGLESVEVEVEVDVSEKGFPGFTIVGLASKAVEEARERVKTAIRNSGASFPEKKITINLAPADLPKEGSAYDLPVAVGILVANGEIGLDLPDSSEILHTANSKTALQTDPKRQARVPSGAEGSVSVEERVRLSRSLPFLLGESYFYGELGLDGKVRHTKGVLLVALKAKREGVKRVFVPIYSASQAAVVEGVEVYPVRDLRELVEHLAGRKLIQPMKVIEPEKVVTESEALVDLREIVGQEQAKRALVVAAAGGHNLLMTGAPGAGKTMLAKAMPGILPPLSADESLEVTRIYSVAGLMGEGEALVRRRPFRAPHHTTSRVGLIGGGSNPQPGEVSLAHLGVLFLDELPEFSRASLEVLRQPMEDGVVTISRARARASYPADFMLLASANPCPCGFKGHPTRVCHCTPKQIASYRRRISGPILDRIDMHVWVEPVETAKLAKVGDGVSTAEAREMVLRARRIQAKRFKNLKGIYTNSQMGNKLVRKFCPLKPEVEGMLRQAVERFNLSARGYFKVIKVARTIADIEGSETIEEDHMYEAVQYREDRDK